MKQSTQEITKEVLFQKLGQTWFIFTEINEEVVYSAMPEGMDFTYFLISCLNFA